MSHKLTEETSLIDFTPKPDPSPLHYNLPITENEVQFNIKECSKISAPGYDKIPTVFLQKLHPRAITHFTSLLNQIFHSSTFPSNWKLAIVIPILKPNKDPTLPLFYRPISLLSTLAKILEKILNKRLTWFLESNNLINNSQYGCRKGRSTTMALTELDALIHQANDNKSTLYSVFFDLENAFPRVWRHHILLTLHKYGFRGLLPQLLQNYLQNRSFQVRVANQLSSIQTQDNGVPQGSPLSGTLFMIAINDILNKIAFPVKPILYADDLSVHIQTNNQIRAHRILQLTISSILAWLAHYGFRISTSKTCLVIFDKKTAKIPFPPSSSTPRPSQDKKQSNSSASASTLNTHGFHTLKKLKQKASEL